MKFLKERGLLAKNKTQGITLIALVITIIVLLILAGVTIATLTGDNGILTRANNAKEQTENAEEKEKVKLSSTAALTKATGEEINQEDLEEELGEYFETGKYAVEEGTNEDGIEGYVVTITEKDPNGREYFVDKNGAMSETADKEDSRTITFYINDISFECLEGEVWGDWITSNEELLSQNGFADLATLPMWGSVIGIYCGGGLLEPYLSNETGSNVFVDEQIQNLHKYRWE